MDIHKKMYYQIYITEYVWQELIVKLIFDRCGANILHIVMDTGVFFCRLVAGDRIANFGHSDMQQDDFNMIFPNMTTYRDINTNSR